MGRSCCPTFSPFAQFPSCPEAVSPTGLFSLIQHPVKGHSLNLVSLILPGMVLLHLLVLSRGGLLKSPLMAKVSREITLKAGLSSPVLYSQTLVQSLASRGQSVLAEESSKAAEMGRAGRGSCRSLRPLFLALGG